MILTDDIINKTIKLSGFEVEAISSDIKESLKRIILFAEKVNKFKFRSDAEKCFVSAESLRDGCAEKSFLRDELLRNAHNTVEGCFTINKILE